MIAAGHNMLGLSMAPATGKLVAELVNRGGAAHRPETVSGRSSRSTEGGKGESETRGEGRTR